MWESNSLHLLVKNIVFASEAPPDPTQRNFCATEFDEIDNTQILQKYKTCCWINNFLVQEQQNWVQTADISLA